MAHPGLRVQCLLPWCVSLAQTGGSQQQSFFWVSGSRMLDFMGHCFKCCGCFDLAELAPSPQIHVLRKDLFLFTKFVMPFMQNMLLMGVRFMVFLDTAVALHSSSQPYSLWSAVCSSQPPFPVCAKIFAWTKVDFGLRTRNSLVS